MSAGPILFAVVRNPLTLLCGLLMLHLSHLGCLALQLILMMIVRKSRFGAILAQIAIQLPPAPLRQLSRLPRHNDRRYPRPGPRWVTFPNRLGNVASPKTFTRFWRRSLCPLRPLQQRQLIHLPQHPLPLLRTPRCLPLQSGPLQLHPLFLRLRPRLLTPLALTHWWLRWLGLRPFLLNKRPRMSPFKRRWKLSYRWGDVSHFTSIKVLGKNCSPPHLACN